MITKYVLRHANSLLDHYGNEEAWFIGNTKYENMLWNGLSWSRRGTALKFYSKEEADMCAKRDGLVPNENTN
jgi:hypothetical protein